MGDLMPSSDGYAGSREIPTGYYTDLKNEMERIGDRICERDKKYHTGSSRLVLKTETTHGELRMPEIVRAVME